MEHIYRHIMNHLDPNSILIHYHHGFRPRHSYEMQLITIIESVAGNLDLGQQSYLLLVDFSKAFDTVPHRRLLNKLVFADDVVFYGVIKVYNDAESLQQDLNTLVH